MSLFVVVFFCVKVCSAFFVTNDTMSFFIFNLSDLTKSLILLITKRFMVKTVEAETIA